MKNARLQLILATMLIASCSDEEKKDQKYSFSSTATSVLKSSKLVKGAFLVASNVEDSQYKGSDLLCSSVICFTPEGVVGKYYAIALMIQSTGRGMTAYFEKDGWSAITGTSEQFDFNFKSPISYSGTLICCAGEGDLKNQNSYFSDVSYLFAYLDVTFVVSSASGAQGDAVGQHSVRFIFADDATAGAKRGDLQILDDGIYKWMNTDGTLSATRPSSPIKMNDKVVNWQDPFGEAISIPVMSAGLKEDGNNGPLGTSETQLQASKTYSFDFNASGLVVFPDLLHADGGMLTGRKALLEKIHLHGLPYAIRGEMKLPKTLLEIN